MKEINVTGQKRTDLGKKASKSLRKEGFIPCNLYGEKKDANGAPEAMSFAVPFTELRKIIYTPHVYVINLIIDGESHTAIMKEIQFHPTTDAPLHVDFYEVNDQKTRYYFMREKFMRDGRELSLDAVIYDRLKEKEQTMLDAIDRGCLEGGYLDDEDLRIVFERLLGEDAKSLEY